MNRPATASACALLLIAACALLAGEGEYVWKDGKWVKAPPPTAGTPAGDLAAIRKLVEGRQEGKAVDATESFLKKHYDDPGCEEAMMLAGQAELNREHYYQAFEWFEKQLSRYPSGEHYERALIREYEIADAFLKGKKRIAMKVFQLPAESEGLDILSRVAEHAPGTAIAEKALLRIGEHHFYTKDFPAAVQAYDHYLKLFGKSDKAPYAMLRAARAMYASFRGMEYDDTPLIDAEQRFREFAQRHPVSAEQENVPAMLKIIRAARGQKLYGTAQFYERTKRPQAAVFYYNRVAEDFADTEWAARAKGDLARLGVKRVEPGEPVAPTSRPAETPKTQPATQEAGVNK